jgi:hypothetical protein
MSSYQETALHVSSGISTHHQERKQLYLQHLLFVTLLLASQEKIFSEELGWQQRYSSVHSQYQG